LFILAYPLIYYIHFVVITTLLIHNDNVKIAGSMYTTLFSNYIKL